MGRGASRCGAGPPWVGAGLCVMRMGRRIPHLQSEAQEVPEPRRGAGRLPAHSRTLTPCVSSGQASAPAAVGGRTRRVPRVAWPKLCRHRGPFKRTLASNTDFGGTKRKTSTN